MTDSDDPRPDVQQFLRDHAASMERQASPVDPAEVSHRVVPRSLEPKRWARTPVAVAYGARRQPAVAAAVIAALLIGSLGGFAVGRGSTPADSVTAHGAGDVTTPTVVESAQGVSADGRFFYGEMNPPTTTRLFIRTTADGIALRAYLMEYDQQVNEKMAGCDPSSWCPPPECRSPNSFMAEVSNELAVSQGGAQPLPFDGPAASRGTVPLGVTEGAPASVTMVQTNSDVRMVRATWQDGFVDEMAPVNGWAIVAHDGAADPTSLEAILDAGSYNIPRDMSYPAQCNPPPPAPPELPPAGEEQPDDIESARAGVTEVYETVFTHGFESPGDGTYVEDGENIAAVGAQVKSSFPEATDTIEVEVGEIRFLSKTEAALYFELKYQGGALFGQQVGYAKFIDGSWKIARDTMCMVFGWGGAQCDPPPDPARSGGGQMYATTESNSGSASSGGG